MTGIELRGRRDPPTADTQRSRTDNKDVRCLHPLLRLVPHYIELAGVQTFVNLLALTLAVLSSPNHSRFIHAAA